MLREPLRECWPSLRLLFSPFTAPWRASLCLPPRSWTIRSSRPACHRASRLRTLAPRGFPIPLASGWLPRALAPGTKSPAETRSGPRRGDWLLRMACGCAGLAASLQAVLHTIENPAGNRALLPRSSPAAAPAQPEISFETKRPLAGASAAAWTCRAFAAHRRQSPGRVRSAPAAPRAAAARADRGTSPHELAAPVVHFPRRRNPRSAARFVRAGVLRGAALQARTLRSLPTAFLWP